MRLSLAPPYLGNVQWFRRRVVVHGTLSRTSLSARWAACSFQVIAMCCPLRLVTTTKSVITSHLYSIKKIWVNLNSFPITFLMIFFFLDLHNLDSLDEWCAYGLSFADKCVRWRTAKNSTNGSKLRQSNGNGSLLPRSRIIFWKPHDVFVSILAWGT